MADREDIDALLIGALYGELDEADRARLDTHLASHPQDRMALDAMKSTRGLLRDAEVATAMVEPPAALSALLLQEAARRAPAVRTATGSGGLLGFLASFLRPVMAHPALSAAATLVVIGGVAGALYLSGSARTVQPDAAGEAALEHSAPAGNVAAAPADDPAPSFDIWSAPITIANRSGQDLTGSEAERQVAAGRGSAAVTANLDGLRAGSDAYRVALADSKEQAPKEEAQGTLGFALTDRAASAAATKDLAEGRAAGPGVAHDKGKMAKGAGAGSDRYLEVAGERDEPALRGYRDDTVAGDALAVDGRFKADGAQGQVDTTKLSQGPSPSPPPPPTAPSPVLKPGAAPRTPAATTPSRTASIATTPSGAATLPADPSRVAPYNARSDAATLLWARDQHAKMVKLVEAGKCTEVGPIGVQLQRRAPDYYQDNVYNDRRIRACRPYVDKARRAAEPARKRDAPNAAVDEAAAPDKAAN